jgi:hypothetical protein
VGGHPQQVCSRVRGGGRHWALRCRRVAVRARRRVRAVPDLRQRALALRTAPGGHRSRLPCHLRRPNARSKDAAVMRAPRQRTRCQPNFHTHQGATMSRKLRPLAAVAIIGLIGAGCSNGSAENGNTGAASSSGTASNTGTASNKRATNQDKIASPSSAGSSPSPAGSPSSPAGLPRSAGSPSSPAGSSPSPAGSSPSPAGLPRSAGSPSSPAGSPRSAGSPPSPAGRLPYAGSKDAAVARTLGIGAGVNAITTLGEKA